MLKDFAPVNRIIVALIMTPSVAIIITLIWEARENVVRFIEILCNSEMLNILLPDKNAFLSCSYMV